jgi:hypothetical protein
MEPITSLHGHVGYPLSLIIRLKPLLSCLLIFAIRKIHKQSILGYAYNIQEQHLR